MKTVRHIRWCGNKALLHAHRYFGMSMVVAPAYLVYLKLSQAWGFVTFGMAEYTMQACLLVAMMLVLWRFRLSFLFSFVTPVIYGFALDGSMTLAALIIADGLLWRAVFYVTGMALGAAVVAFIFKTYIAPQVYELFGRDYSVFCVLRAVSL